VAENKVLRKIFGPKKDEVSEQLRILHNEELCVRIVASGRLQWAGHVKRIGRQGMVTEQ
jgi:hypothetical protein